MGDIDKNKLRKLLYKFYEENDPVTLSVGFDINGLVEFTVNKGLNVLNRMLNKKYGKMIDLDDRVEGALATVRRVSALAQSALIQSKQVEYRQQLYNYFEKNDPDMVSPAMGTQFEKFIQFAMLNGMDKLSGKLQKRYGEPITMAADGNNTKNATRDDDDGALDLNSGLNPFQLDRNRLRKDLEYFYTSMEDTEQLEALDEIVDWCCQIGIDEFDKKVQQLYGTSLNELLDEAGRSPHQNGGEAAKAPAMPERREIPPVNQAQEFDIVVEEVEVPGVSKPFEEMEDYEILSELRAFYEKHDTENLGNLAKVLDLSRKIGRDALNNHLTKIYGEGVKPVPTIERRERKVPRAAPPMPDRAMQPPGMPERRDIPAFQPAGAVAPNGADPKQFNPFQANPQEAEDENIPEFLRKQRAMAARIKGGVARRRGADGEYETVNLLIDICKVYVLDPMDGVCKNCGFAKGDHAWIKQKKKRR